MNDTKIEWHEDRMKLYEMEGDIKRVWGLNFEKRENSKKTHKNHDFIHQRYHSAGTEIRTQGTNSMAYGTRRFNAALTRALQ